VTGNARFQFRGIAQGDAAERSAAIGAGGARRGTEQRRADRDRRGGEGPRPARSSVQQASVRSGRCSGLFRSRRRDDAPRSRDMDDHLTAILGCSLASATVVGNSSGQARCKRHEAGLLEHGHTAVPASRAAAAPVNEDNRCGARGVARGQAGMLVPSAGGLARWRWSGPLSSLRGQTGKVHVRTYGAHGHAVIPETGAFITDRRPIVGGSQ